MQNFTAKTEFATTYLAAISDAGFHYREHDPEEDMRLPLMRAHREIGSSAGVFLSLIGNHIVDADYHNLRAYLLAGLADGLGVPHLILRYGEFTPPFDLRDDITPIQELDGISAKIEAFKPAVLEALQAYRKPKRGLSTSHLTQLSVGASAAENEFRRLDSYFLETREYFRALRGEAQLVVGRKGTGKTAIFWQLREKLRSNRANVVLDLRPEGFHLRKLNELVAENFSEATHAHTMTAFWEYVLLLELAHKIIEDDEFLLERDNRVAAPYRKLESIYMDWEDAREGDFPERLLRLIKRLQKDLSVYIEDGSKKILTTPQITEVIFRKDIKLLRDCIIDYLSLKKQTYILVDNLDKGWNTTGVTLADTTLVQALIDAGRKIQRDALRRDRQINICVFLRDDVYEFLISDAADRGKETIIRIGWSDESAMLALINMRLAVSSDELGLESPLTWADIATPFVAGQSSFSYLALHSMQRPRAMLDIVELALSTASQAGHTLITADDLGRAVTSYSIELLQGINFEIRDLFPPGERVVYNFVGTEHVFEVDYVADIISKHVGQNDDSQKLLDIMLWLGFFGVANADGKEIYIFDVGENLDLLKAQVVGAKRQRLVIHPMFRLALQRHAFG